MNPRLVAVLSRTMEHRDRRTLIASMTRRTDRICFLLSFARLSRRINNSDRLGCKSSRIGIGGKETREVSSHTPSLVGHIVQFSVRYTLVSRYVDQKEKKKGKITRNILSDSGSVSARTKLLCANGYPESGWGGVRSAKSYTTRHRVH